MNSTRIDATCKSCFGIRYWPPTSSAIRWPVSVNQDLISGPQ